MSNNPEYLFNESIQVGVDYTDIERVRGYDQLHSRFRDFDAEAGRIIEALGLSDDAVLLDIGCGTGGLSAAFAQRCRQVFAVDVSDVMLQVLREKIEQRQLNNVTTTQAGFLTYEHHGPAPDAVVISIAFHHLPDFWKQIALCRIHDILKPGGKLFLSDVVFDFLPRDYQTTVDQWLSEMEKMGGSENAAESAIHIKEEYSTFDWIMTGLLERAGFTVESNEVVMPLIRAYVCSR